MVLLGDSHAGVLANSVRTLAEANDLNYLQITSAGCLHITGLGTGLCEQRSAELKAFLEEFPVASIIYSSRLPLALELERFDNQEGDKEAKFKPVDSEKVLITRPVRSASIEQRMTTWVKLGYPLVIVYPVPEQGFHVPSKLFSQRPIITKKEQLPNLSTSYVVFKKRVSSSYKTLDRVRGKRVHRVYPEYLFCSEKSQRCFASQGERLYFTSDNHVSPLGADMIVTEVARTLELEVPAGLRK